MRHLNEYGELIAESKTDEPTPEEIHRRCLSIRKEWSPRETMKRAGIHARRPWLPPETRISWDDDATLSGVGTFWND